MIDSTDAPAQSMLNLCCHMGPAKAAKRPASHTVPAVSKPSDKMPGYCRLQELASGCMQSSTALSENIMKPTDPSPIKPAGVRLAA